jgi:hypothetical protein
MKLFAFEFLNRFLKRIFFTFRTMTRLFCIFLCYLLLSGFTCLGQNLSFSPFSVPFSKNGNLLSNPWSGSYNSGQFWPCDLNNDGEDDLLVFDKTSDRVLTYLASVENGNPVWKHNSDYEDLIPQMDSWMASADFNCDGKMDLFTQTSLGIKVFKNISIGPGPVGFTLEMDGVFSQGLSGQVNVQVNNYGAPSFTDVDNDGDLDILNFDFSGNTVEYHKNLSIENTGNCSGFILKKDTCVFGRFATKPVCGQIKLNTTCFGLRPPPGQGTDPIARIQHLGSQLCALDLDADGDKDLLVGDLGCPLLNRLTNGGSPNAAIMVSADTLFPNPTHYIKLPFFPSAYHLDLNFDGNKDLMVSPTYFSNVSEGYAINGAEGSHFYRNQSSGTPDFQWVGKDFFQNQNIDVGEESTPAFADADGDGDLDLWIGNLGLKNGNLVQGKIAFFRNTGNAHFPSFAWETDDYLNLSSLLRKRVRPIFQDFNGDGALDFGWISAKGTISPTIPDSTRLFVLLNQNPVGQPLSFGPISQAIRYPFSFDLYDSPVWIDVDGDNIKDMLLGKYNNGRIHFWKITSSWPNLQFQLVNSNFGNVARYPFANNSNLAIADVDQNGTQDLAVGDFSGNLKWFKSFLQNPGNTFPADSTWYQNTVLSQRLSRQWGRFMVPALADLNGDGFPEMALGNMGGGLCLFVNRLGPNGVSKTVSLPKWQIYPNPLSENGQLYWLGSWPEKVSLFSTQGKCLRIWEKSELDSEKPLEIKGFPKGLYFISFSGENQKHTFSLSIP